MSVDGLRRADERCSPTARRVGAGPAGTVGSFEGLLVIERPLPWPRDAVDLDELRDLRPALQAAAAEGRAHRVQLVAAAHVPDRVRLTYHRRPDGLFDGYRRAGFDVPAPTLGDLAGDLLAGRIAAGLGPGHTEVLLCTHGRRDVCCGSSGTLLHAELTRAGLPPGVALRRTSHTGGHRFAPTALVLPHGTGWAWLDGPTFTGIVTQTLRPEVAARHYRGCMGLDGPEVQTVDAALFAERGWAWLSTPRRGRVESRDGDEAVVTMEHRPSGARATSSLRAVARVSGRSPVPQCGAPLDGTEAQQEDWTVVDVVDL